MTNFLFFIIKDILVIKCFKIFILLHIQTEFLLILERFPPKFSEMMNKGLGVKPEINLQNTHHYLKLEVN